MEANDRFGSSRWPIHVGGLLACVVLMGLFYFAGLRPLAAAYTEQSARVEQLEAQRKLSDRLTRSLQGLQQQLASTQQSLAAIPNPLQPARQINHRLALVTDLANECQVRIEQIQPKSGRSGAFYDVVPIEVTGGASYRTFVSFLHGLHETFGDLGVESFALSANPVDLRAEPAFELQLLWYAQPTFKSAKK